MHCSRWLPVVLGLLPIASAACSSARDSPRDDSAREEGVARSSAALSFPSGLFRGQLRQTTTVKRTSAPFGAHLSYFGGRVVSNIQVVQVLYGTGSYIPQVTTTNSPSMATFYQGVLNSPYVDWLTEYNTTDPVAGTNQIIGRGTFSSQVTITPAPQNDGPVIDDTNIQAELTAQIQAGNVPAPTHDAAGNDNTYYAIFFPHGKTITLGGTASCSFFCAYHGTIADAGGAGEVYYGVHPDFQPGSGCETGCGAASTVFGNYTQVASHELMETITDSEVGLTSTVGLPMAWYDPSYGEIGDICNDQNAQIVGGDGVTYDVQTEFSNSQNNCIVSGPHVNPLLVDPSDEVCGATAGTVNVTALGGPEGFPGDVALSLTQVSPTPPPGGEITATFAPNPISSPPAQGSTATMTIQGTASTPAGTYTLTVQGVSGGVTATASTTFVVRNQAPGAVVLQSPASGADGVAFNPTFTWAASTQADSYTLSLYTSGDCSGTPLHQYTTSSTSFPVPPGDALPTFTSLSWQVAASNSCVPQTVSACSTFRTESCGTGTVDLVRNGGFEQGLAGWNVVASDPAPVVSTANPHGGANALGVGEFFFTFEPFGDSAVSQVLTIPAGASPNLSFWEWPLNFNAFTASQYVTVTPLSPVGPTVTLMSELSDAQTYLLRQFSLQAFAGQTVRVSFGVHQNGDFGGTGMNIDDVSAVYTQCGPPDFTLQVAPVATGEVCAGASLGYTVSVASLNGPNFTSPVTLTATGLPPNATATFATNPVSPGASTTMTLLTTRPTIGQTYGFTVSGTAVNPPPTGPRVATTAVQIDANAPQAPQVLSPTNGAVNVPLRPTLSWTAPFVPDAIKKAAVVPTPFAFGASQYHLQIATDSAFTRIVTDTMLTDTTFTPASDLATATQYFWRVTATNQCGSSPASSVASFIVGACSEVWSALAAVPSSNGGVENGAAVAVPSVGKIYVIGGIDGFFLSNHTWAYDPTADSWTQKADVPPPGVGVTYGSAVAIGETIYVFGGNFSGQTLWKYDVPSDTWSQGAPLPFFNNASAVSAIGGKIYIAYGTGFFNETWQYDPATDAYSQKANAPFLPVDQDVHAVAFGGDMHVFGGGIGGSSHVVYTPATDTWTTAPPMPFGVTDPAVGVLAGQIYVVGGQPIAYTQIYDPASGAWTQGMPIAGASNGVEGTMGAVLGLRLHVIGGFNNTTGITANHWQFHPCTLGDLSSGAVLPFAVDGDGHVSGVTNERTSLFIANSLSNAPLTATCFLYGVNGAVLGHAQFKAAPGEVHAVTDIVRVLKGATTVQNVMGSLAVFGTDLLRIEASVVNNATGDSAFEDGQSMKGELAGFLPAIEEDSDATRTVFSNLSPNTAILQLVAYPAGGGETPSSATLAILGGHSSVNYADVVQQLKLPRGFVGQLQFSSNQPVAAAARTVVPKTAYSGFEPVRSISDAASTVYAPYVEDTAAFSTSLLVSNPTLNPADVTVTFVDTEDTTGGTSGSVSSRDVPIAVNADTSIPDVVRWVLRETTTTPSGKHGFLVVTTPQGVTAQAKLVDNVTADPATPGLESAVTSAFSPFLIRVEPITLQLAASSAATFSAVTLAAGATTTTALSRFGVSNPGATTATVELAAINATGGTPTQPFVVTLPPNAQFFTEDLVSAMGLPPIFLGSLSVRSDVPVLVYNHRRSGDTGDVIPVYAQ